MTAIEKAILRPFSIDGGDFETPTAVVENQALAYDGSATYFDENGRADLADRARQTAAWWRALATLPDKASERLLSELQLKGGETINALLALAEKGDAALLCLALLANRILAGLFDMAAAGRKPAARALMTGVSETMNNFELLATRKPELFREWARGQIAIPGLISRKKDQTRQNELLLKALQQGEDCHLAILPTGKPGKSWKFDGTALIAVRLIAHIQSSNAAYSSDTLYAGGAYPELPAWRHDASKLPPFSKKVSREWAEAAWSVLAEISPKKQPELHPRLQHFFKVRQSRTDYPNRTGAKDDGSPTKRQSPSIPKHDMRETLFTVFKRIASEGSPPKKVAKTKRKQ